MKERNMEVTFSSLIEGSAIKASFILTPF